MKKQKTYRIIKITHGDKSIHYEVQKRAWFGKWISFLDDFNSPIEFISFEDCEKFVMNLLVDPIAEVVKEY